MLFYFSDLIKTRDELHISSAVVVLAAAAVASALILRICDILYYILFYCILIF